MRILLIEHDPGIIKLFIKKFESVYDIIHTETGEHALKIIRDQQIDLILLGHRLPDFEGINFIKTIQSLNIIVPPFVIITGGGDEIIAVELMKLGAKDYLLKDIRFWELLPRVIDRIDKEIQNEQKRIEAESSLLRMEDLLEKTQSIAKVGSWEYDLINNTLIWSNEVFNIFGFDKETFSPSLDAFLMAVYKEDKEKVWSSYEKSLLNHNSSYEVEHRIIKNDTKEIRILHEKGENIFDENGAPVKTIGMVQDITERKIFEETLNRLVIKTSRQFGQDFFNTMVIQLAKALKADYTLIGELSGNEITKVKSIAVAIGEAIGDNIEYSLDGTPCANVIGKTVCSYAQNVDKLFPTDYLLAEMGVTGYVGYPLFDSQENSLGIVVALYKKPISNPKFAETILQIFSERIGSEIERSRTEELVNLQADALDALAGSVAIYNDKGDYVWINKTFTQLTGYTFNDLKGKNINDVELDQHDEEAVQSLWDTINSGNVWVGKLFNKRKDGSSYIVEQAITPISDDGVIKNLISIKRELTKNRV